MLIKRQGGDLKLFSKIALVFSLVTVCALYSTFKTSETVSASREIASIEKSFNFLSLKELKLLNENDLKGYLTDLSSAMSKAGSLEGAFKDSKKTNISFNLINKAYASIYCPVKGLHPAKVINESECENQAEGIKITPASKPDFMENDVVGNNLFCTEGLKMCNPALVGFSYDFGKPKLRCLQDASNAKCAELEVTGDQLKKSLEVLAKAAPDFWKEFEDGILNTCFEDGAFKEGDESCGYVRDKMNHSAASYRTKLTRDYKDLASKLRQGDSTEKACNQFQVSSDDTRRLRDHRNFNLPGQKVFVRNGQCWRLPSDTVVAKVGERYQFLTPGKDSPILTLGGDEGFFYNFQCGPCNDATTLSRCLFEQRHARDDRDYDKLSSLKIETTDDCRSFLSELRSKNLPGVVFEKYQNQDKRFYNSSAID